MQQLNTLESDFLIKLHERVGSPLLDKLFSAISFLSEIGWVFILLGIVLLCFKKTRRLGAGVLVALLLDLILVNLCIKPIVSRVRPYEWNALLTPVPARLPADASFPSGHAASAFAAASALRKGDMRLYIPVLALACLTAFSRVYLGVHYPSDVICGALCGAICGTASRRLVPAIPFFRREKNK